MLVSGPLLAQSTLTPEQLTVRVQRLTELSQRSEAKLSAAQSQLKAVSQELERIGRQVDNRAMMDMIQQVDQISEEISFLRGEIEVQTNEIVQIKKRQRELYQDIDRRLRDLESRSVSQAPAYVPPAGSSSQAAGSAGTGGESLSLASSAASTGSSGSSVGTTAGSTVAAAASAGGSEEKVAYQAAFDTLKEGRYKDAKTAFAGFLEKYPGSSFAGNAQYWLGEAHYVTRNFQQGIVEFEKVLNSYPSSNKVPDAMLKLGYTFYELKQYSQAKAVLQDLRNRFPNETAASLAGKRLERIQKEGH